MERLGVNLSGRAFASHLLDPGYDSLHCPEKEKEG